MANRIASFNQSNVEELSRQVQRALEAVAAEHGLVVQRGNGKFSPGTFTPKFSLSTVITVVQDNGTASPTAKSVPSSFTSGAARVGLQPNDFDRSFTSNGRRFRVTGLKLSSYKYPVLALCINDGKTYKFSGDIVRRLLATERA